jgi:hypothetical protein
VSPQISSRDHRNGELPPFRPLCRPLCGLEANVVLRGSQDHPLQKGGGGELGADCRLSGVCTAIIGDVVPESFLGHYGCGGGERCGSRDPMLESESRSGMVRWPQAACSLSSGIDGTMSRLRSAWQNVNGTYADTLFETPFVQHPFRINYYGRLPKELITTVRTMASE